MSLTQVDSAANSRNFDSFNTTGCCKRKGMCFEIPAGQCTANQPIMENPNSIGKHVFVECWATYKHTSLTPIDWGEILVLKLWSQNLTRHDFKNVLAYREIVSRA